MLLEETTEYHQKCLDNILKGGLSWIDKHKDSKDFFVLLEYTLTMDMKSPNVLTNIIARLAVIGLHTTIIKFKENNP